MGSVFTFYLIYIHANKEIDATKLYRLKNLRTFQDIFLQFYSTNQKSQLPLGLWIKTCLSLYTLDLYIICIGKQENLTVIKIGSLGWNLKSGMVKKFVIIANYLVQTKIAIIEYLVH